MIRRSVRSTISTRADTGEVAEEGGGIGASGTIIAGTKPDSGAVSCRKRNTRPMHHFGSTGTYNGQDNEAQHRDSGKHYGGIPCPPGQPLPSRPCADEGIRFSPLGPVVPMICSPTHWGNP